MQTDHSVGSPLRAAIIGMGGFAGAHQRAIRTLEEEGACRLVCSCDPNPDAFAEQREAWDYAGRGVRVTTDYRRMLDEWGGELDLVTVPTPVPLHAPMHRACVERGLACYLEKPPTLDHAELAEMLAVEARAAKQTFVGFSNIVEPARQALKARLVHGEFGRVRRVTFLGTWPRSTAYFTRAPWAARLMMDDRLVLDSCLGNAMSHYLHNLLFWAGNEDVFSWADVAAVQAELYRAHAIEGTDTIFLRGECANVVELWVAATHACAGEHRHWERVECEQATLTYVTGQHYRIDRKDGASETHPLGWDDLLRENLRAYLRYLRGEAPRPVTRLIDTRPFVHCYNLAYVAARAITPVPAASIHRSPAKDGAYVAIADIQEACEAFCANGRFPSVQGLDWGRPGGRATIDELPQLRDVVKRMRGIGSSD